MTIQQIIQAIRSDVADIPASDTLEQAHIDDVLSWIDSGANVFRIARPDKPPKHLVSYFVLIDPEHRSVLLGDHIKAQLWLPPGGHVELGEHPVATVRRECQEELYRPAVFLQGNEKPFFVTVTDTVGLTAGHTDVSLWYVLAGSIHDKILVNRDEFTDMNWFDFDEILQSHPSLFDPHMQRFIRKIQQEPILQNES